MIRKLLSDTLIYAVGPQLPKLASLFLYPILTKHLTPTDYGIYGVVISYVGLVAFLKELGFNVTFFNSFYRHPKRYPWIWRQLLGIVLAWSVPYAVILAAVVAIAVPSEGREHLSAVIACLCLPALGLEQTALVGSYLYRAQARPAPVVAITVFSGIVAVVSNYVTIAEWEMGYLGWFLSIFLSSLSAAIPYGYLLYVRNRMWPIFRWRIRRLKSYLRVSLPVIPHNYSGYLLDSSDRVVMKLLGTPIVQIGLYNIAYLFGTYFGMLEFAISQAAAPLYMKLYSERNEAEARRMTFVIQITLLAASALTCLWLKEIFFLLVRNSDLRTAYPIAIPVIMGLNYRAMYYVTTNYLFYEEKTSTILRISCVAALVNIGLNVLLIPRFGVFAAAVTTFGSYLLLGYGGFLLQEFRKHMRLEYYPFLWLTVTVALTGGVYLLRDAPLAAKMASSVVVVLIGVFALRSQLRTSRRFS